MVRDISFLYYDPEKFEGLILDPSSQPRLFEELASISKAASQDMPSEVHLLHREDMTLARRGDRKVIGIGLPFFGALTVSQLRATIAYKFGRYYRIDESSRPEILMKRDSYKRSLEMQPFGLAPSDFDEAEASKYLLDTDSIARQQEFIADRFAENIAGIGAADTSPTSRALTEVWELYQSELDLVFSWGLVPPMFEGYPRYLQTEWISQLVSNKVKLRKGHSGENGGLPDGDQFLKERREILQKLPPGQQMVDERWASTLLDNISQFEVQCVKLSLGYGRLRDDFKSITWSEIIPLFYIPFWRSVVRRQQAALRGLTPERLPEIAKNFDSFIDKLIDPGEYRPATPNWEKAYESRWFEGYRVIEAALSLSLIRQGWKPNHAPGESIFLTSNDGQKIYPREFMSGKLLPEDSKVKCQNVGILGADLAQVADELI